MLHFINGGNHPTHANIKSEPPTELQLAEKYNSSPCGISGYMWCDSPMFFLKSRYAEAHAEPILDQQQDLYNTSVDYSPTDGLHVKFTRPLITEDPQDAQLASNSNACFHVLAAWGQVSANDDKSEEKILHYHGQEQRGVTAQQFCFPPSRICTEGGL